MTEFACVVPPSPAEWRAMENTHLAWLRIAHVIANAGLAAAASFFHEFAELAAAAESDSLMRASQSDSDC